MAEEPAGAAPPPCLTRDAPRRCAPQPLCPRGRPPSTVGRDWWRSVQLCHHLHAPPALARALRMEASPSPVYGAALLMRFGAYPPSRVQIPPPPHHTEAPVPRTGASVVPRRLPSSGRVRLMDFASRRRSCNVVLATPTGQKNPRSTSTRSLTDRASDYGSEGCRFESCRVHIDKRPRSNPGPLALPGQRRSTATVSVGTAHRVAHFFLARFGVEPPASLQSRT